MKANLILAEAKKTWVRPALKELSVNLGGGSGADGGIWSSEPG